MKHVVAQAVVTTLVVGTLAMGAESETRCTRVVSLDGEWLLATDPKDAGRTQQWMLKPVPEAKKAKVPWIIQDTFPGYHGLAWYWRTFTPPPNPHAQGRYLLRFWAVDYKAEVWLNGAKAGEHEGGESPFTLDVTDSVKAGAPNLLAVRVLNPTHAPIDGIVLNETPHRNKVIPYSSGSAWNQGGIMDSVELLLAPPVRLADIFARADWKTGMVRIEATAHSALAGPAKGQMEFTLAPAASGETLVTARVERQLAPGDTLVEAELRVERPHLWDLNDPFLYRVTARVRAEGSEAMDEHSVRCGFRDFRFENGAFRLNGRRIYLRCSHTGNCCPVGLEMPVDPDWLRRDLVNVKAMRFNAIRWISGVAKRYQLDLCDELGLLVYEESYAGWCLADSPKMAERYDESVLGMVRRDRNHPSIVIWGLLNETPDGPVFRHAVQTLPALRKLDDSRMVLLNSGRWDRVATASERIIGVEGWRSADRVDPCVIRNVTDHVVRGLGITWAPGQLSFHPGRDGEYSVVRWTAPAAGRAEVGATFIGIAQKATTDVHLLHSGKALGDAFINVKGAGNEAQFVKSLEVQKGDTLDAVVGWGNGNYGADTTGLDVTVRAEGGKASHAAADFSIKGNPNGLWSYGQLAPGPTPNSATFKLYPKRTPGEEAELAVGTFSNPGSAVWEDTMDDQHPYQRVPHTADVIRTLRTVGKAERPLFLSEYGVGSAVDLLRVVRLYEQLGKGEADDARFYRAQRDKFLADWERWRLAEAFGRPEDFFAQSNAKMAGQRLLGINAIRSNPNIVGYSLTGTVDQGMTGEGLFTTFRELKPGTVDALFDGFAPLRFCLFAEPANVYRGSKMHLEAVLANEDALLPGDYPVRLQVVGPAVGGASLPGAVGGASLPRVFERTVNLTIPNPKGKAEPPMVLPVFKGDVVVDWPSGKYRFLATIEKGAAAAGEAIEFHVADPAEMPRVEAEVTLWGDDPGLAKWLTDHGVRVAQPPSAVRREVILVGAKPPADATAFSDLARRIARGSTAIFLCPEVFRKGDSPVGWLPLANKGSLAAMRSWVYLKDEWAKPHPIFDGLPAGGLLDLTFYRDLIPDHVWAGQEPPAEAVAGGINASQAYSSGLLVAVYPLGAGRFILNTLRIREELGRHPAAERLLRNLLRYAARDAAKPPAELPANFDAQLKAFGYK